MALEGLRAVQENRDDFPYVSFQRELGYCPGSSLVQISARTSRASLLVSVASTAQSDRTVAAAAGPVAAGLRPRDRA
jgi:hypothetical protein